VVVVGVVVVVVAATALLLPAAAAAPSRGKPSDPRPLSSCTLRRHAALISVAKE
jgi:hypothetical protein